MPRSIQISLIKAIQHTTQSLDAGKRSRYIVDEEKRKHEGQMELLMNILQPDSEIQSSKHDVWKSGGENGVDHVPLPIDIFL